MPLKGLSNLFMSKSAHHLCYKKTSRFQSLLCVPMIIALGGCGMIGNPFGSKDKANAPRFESVLADDDISPPNGPSNSNLFGQNLRGDDARLDRLERAVQDMRNDFDGVRPSIDRLISIEQDIQDLIAQLETLTVSDPAPAPAIAAPQSLQAPQTKNNLMPTAEKMSAPKEKAMATPPVTDGVASVYNVRIGTHPGKTRMVLDVNTKTPFTADLDNGEKILVIELPNANWTAAMNKSVNNPIIASYSVEKKDDAPGSMMIVQLKKGTSISYQQSLKALSGGGQRIVIDLSN